MGVAARDQREVGHPGQSGGWREYHPGIPATGLHAGKTVTGAARGAQRVTAAPPTARGFRRNRSDRIRIAGWAKALFARCPPSITRAYLERWAPFDPGQWPALLLALVA